MLLPYVLDRLFVEGRLTVVDASGRTHVFGTGEPAQQPPVTIRLHDPKLHWRLPMNPHLVFGEAYMDGTLTIEQGSLYDFLDLALRNLARFPPFPESRLGRLWFEARKQWHQRNDAMRSRRNVAHHYDLSGQLYDLFLDRERTYSCAYFASPEMSLEQAQQAKKEHIARKLLLQPGMRVLDIGCGWGGLALHLARDHGAHVTGITLSREQLEVAQGRAKQEGLDDRVQFQLRDYRDEAASYDRVVSVGMFEHVGLPHYRPFFDKVRDLLSDDGVALLHSIGRREGPGITNPWLRKYIFPGGYTPALSEVVPVVEEANLTITDVEILRLHYAETLRRWHERFQANRAKAAALYDERFCRMWEFYLIGSELGFRWNYMMVFQMQLAKRVATVPLTRDYMYPSEAADRRADAQTQPVAALNANRRSA